MGTSKYLREIYHKSLEETQKGLGTKGGFVILALKIAAAVVGISLFVTMGFIKNNEPIYNIVWRIFIGDIVGLIALLFASPIITVFRMPKTAFERDESNQKTIGELQSKINPGIKFEATEFLPSQNPEGKRFIGVKIKNCSGIYGIQRSKVTLEAIKGLTESSIVTFGGEDELPSELAWSDNNRPDTNGYLDIPRGKTKIVDIAIAMSNYQEGFIRLRRGNNIIGFTTGEYSIQFSIDGVTNSGDIPAPQFSARLILQAEKEIRIKDITYIGNAQ